MKRSFISAAATMVMTAAAVVGGLATAGTVSAGDGTPVNVDLYVYAPEANSVLEGLTVEVWDIDGTPELEGTASCPDPTGSGGDLADFAPVNCSVAASGTYALGLDGVPDGATVTADCTPINLPQERIPGETAQFPINSGIAYVECNAYVFQPAVLVDKVVADGTAAPGDFTIEVYDDGGTKQAEGTDTSTELCGQGTPLTNCAVIPVPAGSYRLGELAAPGYVPSNVYCSTFVPEIQQPGEMFPAGIGEFTVSDVPAQDAFPFAQCEVTNRYYEGDLVVTKSVVNDDGGAATPDQFTAEVYTEPGGSLVTTATCAADGSCIDATFPIGDYRIGESGPEGYTPSVSCSVTREPDGPPPIGTTPPVGLIEAIAGDDAVATVEPYGEVTCAITNDDPTTTTTTTTTTTLAPTTTTTTTLAPQLPPTGDSNGTLAIIALVLIASGGVLLALRRRPA